MRSRPSAPYPRATAEAAASSPSVVRGATNRGSNSRFRQAAAEAKYHPLVDGVSSRTSAPMAGIVATGMAGRKHYLC